MQIHQLGDVVDHLLGVLQRPHPLAHHLGADDLVVVKAHPAVGLVAPGRRLADVVQQRRPPQHQIGVAGFLKLDRLPQHRQGMLVDVLVLVVLVDGQPHAPDFGQHYVPHPGLHHQFDAGDRVGPQQRLVQLDGDAFYGDPGQLRRHCGDGLLHPRCDPELQLGHEPRSAQHPQRVVAERHRRLRRGIEHLRLHRRQTVQRIEKLPRAVRVDSDGHGIDAEVPAHQVVLESIAEPHLRIA